MAYHVFPRHWREGVGTAALRATLDALLKTAAVAEVRALVDTRNIASMALLKKLGFERLLTIVDAYDFKGSRSDEHEYAIARERWQEGWPST